VASGIQNETGTLSLGIKADVLDAGSLHKAKTGINSELGKIDFLINGAGGNSPKATTGIEQMLKYDPGEPDKTFFGLNMEGFEWVFDLNLKGTILPTSICWKKVKV